MHLVDDHGAVLFGNVGKVARELLELIVLVGRAAAMRHDTLELRVPSNAMVLLVVHRRIERTRKAVSIDLDEATS